MKQFNRQLAALLASAFLAGAAIAAPISNTDVIKLLDAGMPEEVVIEAIYNGEARFDTSANALISLKAKGATPNVLRAMLDAGQRKKGGAANTAAKAASGYNPEEVTVVVNGEASIMQYRIAQQRSAARAMGFAGMASYATLSGERAQRRLSGTPEFIVSVPRNARASDYLTLANFATRRNGTREVMTGGGYMSYTSGINKSRVVPIVSEALADQSAARDGFVLYSVKPAAPMKSGEYALVLYTGEMRTAGFFAQNANSYFDFGVD
ncbi:hypothetical protein G4G28_14740 [Massilia sp. Dwa41.01b]|uniref:hypothetical protein n=1 Tax=unclassified Massilia TaxID=2609279 RepID=UPI0016025640|nr:MULTISPECIES: hypothetical protein [unclassified Massilia]QNA89418.1 hypothetical protein G4G28_14740 [Massilia sp. Dwa41.01b]QNB00318.1 hypothetical protein G4G31_18320 [Massilia sp. Se16.2.3]